jgi:hypothetical protein
VTAGFLGIMAMAAPTATAGSFPASRDSLAVAPDVTPLLGLSGKLRAVEFTSTAPLLSPLASLIPASVPRNPGVHPTGLFAPDGDPIHAIGLVPLDAKQSGTWRGYRIGFWPGERPTGHRRGRYPLPTGFLEVTPENQDLALSSRFRVRDFLTKDQRGVWPKVLVIQLPLLDKLELIADELEAIGRPAALSVMSGFRTPQYNALGVGPRGGRARNSRHMYGDAADIFVDANRDGRMDDLDGDGKVTTADARWLAAVAARVEARHPTIAGGIGVYRATGAHGPFVHVDTRGTPARW